MPLRRITVIVDVSKLYTDLSVWIFGREEAKLKLTFNITAQQN